MTLRLLSRQNVLASFILISVFSLPLTAAQTQEDSERPPLYSERRGFPKALDRIQDKIARSHQKADYQKLLKAEQEFERLNYEKDQWKAWALDLNIEKWPCQTWCQAVGGSLFYPKNIPTLLASPHTEAGLHRLDIIWALAIAAKYNHPLGKYYLANVLNELHAEYGQGERPALCTALFTEALGCFEKCLHHGEACYILGLNHTTHSHKVGIKEFNIEKALDYHNKGTTPGSREGHQNQFASLLNRSLYHVYLKSSPKKKEYRVLGEKGYGPAYVKAAELKKSHKKKRKLLNQALQVNFHPAFLDLGRLEEQAGQREEAIKQYEAAAEKGLSQGYVRIGKMLLGNMNVRRHARKDLTVLPQEDLKQAMSAYGKAGKAHNPEAWNQLVGLYEELYRLHRNEEDLYEMIEALEQGLRLGSAHAHEKAALLFPQSYTAAVKKYGPAPQGGLCQAIESFLGSSQPVNLLQEED